ncbi:DUF1361 domain-containing protein [Ohtaekwangia sp.]|uniref:DUF1361 domain-containing protein n=1 Tax=Ohtaekwangia sp. TaxID=2066019 RepID=UPI002FDEB649
MISLFHRLRETNRLYILLIFSLTTILCVTLVAFRVQYTANVTFVFLVWNIFLALVPYMISTLLVLYHHTVKNAFWLWLPFMAWLCFFPNAPYILTDLFHLKQRPGVPYWYDLALILFFAWNGLMLGFASMMDIQSVFTTRFKPWIGWTISIGSLLLAGFGIYLGRYLRWNSWDVISSPMHLLHDIATRVLNPFHHPQTYGVTLLFATFLLLGYILLIQFAKVYTRK